MRDATCDIIGKIASKVTNGVLTPGPATPWAVSSVAADVTSWVTRLAKEVTDVVTSAKNLKSLLDKATTLLDDDGEKLSGIAAMALGYGSKNADNAAKGAKHADDGAHATKGADGAVPPGTYDDIKILPRVSDGPTNSAAPKLEVKLRNQPKAPLKTAPAGPAPAKIGRASCRERV